MRTGSIVELNAILERQTTADEVNAAFRSAAETETLLGIMSVLEDEWTSARIIGDPHSSIIDLPLTQVLDGTLVSVAAWYDNEMGYATRIEQKNGCFVGELGKKLGFHPHLRDTRKG